MGPGSAGEAAFVHTASGHQGEAGQQSLRIEQPMLFLCAVTATPARTAVRPALILQGCIAVS